jgi:hypothetical protein
MINSMKKKELLAYLKYLWIFAVFFGLGYYIIKNWEEYSAVMSEMRFSYVLLSALFLLIAKLVLALNVQIAGKYTDVQIGFYKSFYIYSVTQLAKYIPGSIWHFVGRIGMYKKEGFTNNQIRDWMLIENFFLLGGATFSGLIIILFTRINMIIAIIQRINLLLFIPLVGILIAGLLAIIFRKQFQPIIDSVFNKPNLNVVMFFIELSVWIFLGLFWTTLVAQYSFAFTDILYHSGIFALAYVLGFIIPIAPAGIGVRESVLVLGLAPYLDITTSISVSTISRVVFVVVEIILAFILLILAKISHKALTNGEINDSQNK